MAYLIDAVYALLVIAASPWLAVRAWKRRKSREAWGEKLLGRAPRLLAGRQRIWFHAVSVGEVLALRPVVAELARRRPGWEIVISATTPAGLEQARKTFPELVTFHAPLDFSWAVRRAIARIRPTVLALVELELWPNWIGEARRSGARVVLLNGRLSAKSYMGYRKLRPLMKGLLNSFDLIAAQSDEYAERFRGLGANPSRVVVTGSVKYDGLEFDRANAKTLGLRRRLGISPTDLVFVAGSTMEGEDEAAWAAYDSARKLHPHLRLILVPRHPDRAGAIEKALAERGESVSRLSRLEESSTRKGGRAPVVLVDVIGELGAIWGLSDIAFVGGSLFPGRNGQNMMEPAAFGAAVLFGPYTANFKEATEGLLHRGGARRVADPADLARAVLEALEDPENAESRGTEGRRFVSEQQGATDRTLRLLDEVLGSTSASRQMAGRPVFDAMGAGRTVC
jgi:3-deoxy-D-manno-octulosonic-acid transferase